MCVSQLKLCILQLKKDFIPALKYSFRSINLWDLREDEMWHQKITDKVNEVDWVLRSPTYTTGMKEKNCFNR